jgi:uncharacterized protein YndB with AHSA1/START domain
METSFQAEAGVIRWKVHARSAPEKVFEALATDAGRSRYWAQLASEIDGAITFHILSDKPFSGPILSRRKPSLFKLEYYGAIVAFTLSCDDKNGTDLSLFATEVDESTRMEMVAGWVSVLMASKAAVDHNIDLRNQDKSRAWGNGLADSWPSYAIPTL